MIINHNMPAVNTYKNLQTNQAGSNASLAKLSSGLRINKAGDDAAGLAISETMRAQIRGVDQAGRNAQDGVSLIQTAEGAMNEVHSILQRMRELSVESANGTYTASDRSNINLEVNQLNTEINRIATTTTFNNQKLIDGTVSAGNKMILQVGANKGDTLQFQIQGMTTTSVAGGGLSISGMSVSTATKASVAINTLDKAISRVSSGRANLGAMQNRLEHTITNLSTASENTQAAESRVRDADMAQEMMKYSKYNILVQSGTAMLAQANQAPQQVLSLLR